MEVVQEQPQHQFSKPTMATILCCMCGMEIQQNPANMCISCVRENFDITEGINRQLTIHNCRSCNRLVFIIINLNISFFSTFLITHT